MRPKLFLLLIPILTAFKTDAQVQYIPASSQKFALAIGGGVTHTFGDLKTTVFKPAARLNFDYNIGHYISTGIEAQVGMLASGSETISAKSEGLYSESNFYAVNANIRAGLGSVIDESASGFAKFASGIYVGAGLGIYSGEIQSITTHYPSDNKPIKGTIIYETTEMVFPVNLGLNIDLPVYRLAANINYQYNFTTEDALDGYIFYVNSNNDNDAYGFLSVALRYYFGGNRKPVY